MNDHPSEPWHFHKSEYGMADTWMGGEPDSPAVVSLDADGEKVVLWADRDLQPSVQDGVVRRVAACVNACRGVPVESLERIGVADVLAAQAVEMAILRKRLDDALLACVTAKAHLLPTDEAGEQAQKMLAVVVGQIGQH